MLLLPKIAMTTPITPVANAPSPALLARETFSTELPEMHAPTKARKATLVMLFHVKCSIEVPPVELTVLVAVLVSECGEVNKGRDC